MCTYRAKNKLPKEIQKDNDDKRACQRISMSAITSLNQDSSYVKLPRFHFISKKELGGDILG